MEFSAGELVDAFAPRIRQAAVVAVGGVADQRNVSPTAGTPTG